MQDVKMTDQVARHEIVRHENAGHENGGLVMKVMDQVAVHEIATETKLTTDYDHVTSDLLQTFKVNGSKVKVIACHDVIASKIVTFHERIA